MQFLKRRHSIQPIAIVISTACLAVSVSVSARAQAAPQMKTAHPGCEHVSARDCVALAMEAMGGKAKLAAIHNEQLDISAHRQIAEQSYQQAPFLTQYSRISRWVDFDAARVATKTHLVWPESDLGRSQAEGDSTVVATAKAAVTRTGKGDSPASLANAHEAAFILALGPERVLQTAASASDLHYAPDETLRSTPHTAVAFHWNGIPVRVLLNPYNHLPDAVEDTRTFRDFWFAWGDVEQRVYFSNWKVVQGVVFPTSRIEQRNGVPWNSLQIVDAKFNAPHDPKLFTMDAAAASKSEKSAGWNVPFSVTRRITLAPGIDLFQGPWSVTFIRQDDGVLELEAPISPYFVKGALARTHAMYPKLPVKGVLTTSDSWPHVAGVREAVADGLPVYALDLNLPILERMIAAPHTMAPDDLQKHPVPAHWLKVSGKLQIGHGPNRVVLYPLRGESTARQYMVYFPGHKLLYASDTLVLDPQTHALYDPELMREVAQAVKREHLDVETVYAMHQGPTPWREVVKLVAAAMQG
jgi:hypothetical protein